MPRPVINLRGQKFGKLKVIERAGATIENKITWRCHCECGKETIVCGVSLRSGNTRSCGCSRRLCGYLHKENLNSKGNLRHGESNPPTREYKTWVNMKTRCSNHKRPGYKNYGGRGITICEYWLNNYEAFLEDMGRCPNGLQIDRINNDGNYEPENCRWVTPKQQSRNRRTNRVFNINNLRAR